MQPLYNGTCHVGSSIIADLLSYVCTLQVHVGTRGQIATDFGSEIFMNFKKVN